MGSAMRLDDTMAVMVALVACVFDLHTRRIPNVLTFGAAGAALVAAAMMGGVAALGSSAAGWAIGLALWLPIYALGGMGAGDVKLIAAIGAWLGPLGALHAALYAGIAGGILAVVVACATGCVRQTYSNVHMLILHWRVAGFSPQAQLTLDTATSPRLAYAVPTLVGTVVAIWLR
jgi:prepilin peptidase CpaA